MRIPLIHIAQRFESTDIQYFPTPNDKTDALNEFNTDKALDRIAKTDYQQIYQTQTFPIKQ